MHVRESKARDFEDILTENFLVICARKIKGGDISQKLKKRDFRRRKCSARRRSSDDVIREMEKAA
jgi:hypothetical protein